VNQQRTPSATSIGATPALVHNPLYALDPLRDTDEEIEAGRKRNFAKVGSGRPSGLLYTNGPGAVMDLPQFSVMPAGLDDWEPIWKRRDKPPQIHAPRLRRAVASLLNSRDIELRPFPWQAKKISLSREGEDLGVPARVFPQWLRCTGCDLLAPLTRFEYTNKQMYRPDQAVFEHVGCSGRSPTADRVSTDRKARRRTAVAARYLLACIDGHLDEFPYDGWVHQWQPCPKAEFPALRMRDNTSGKGASAVIQCSSCRASRPMSQAQGEVGRTRLPGCRGRHPHLDTFSGPECQRETRLMLVGASNLWFASVQSIVVMPELDKTEVIATLADQVRIALGDKLLRYRANLEMLADLLEGKVAVENHQLAAVIEAALAPAPTPEQQEEELRTWDPVDLLVPEWQYLQRDPIGPSHEDRKSGLTLSKKALDPNLRPAVSRILAVERLRKVNALIGFTRIDEMERVGDLPQRLVPLGREKLKWTVATEDRGEGVFLELNDDLVTLWEQRVLRSDLWEAHRTSHQRNYENRFSETAKRAEADSRLQPPRYWLLHTLAHLLIRQMSMSCGYSAASLSERLYGWSGKPGRAAASGLLICTTASDSDGTLGGLVQLSEPERLQRILESALRRATRCSSDPLCAGRTPSDPEDFLHGAACHCCAMASETSCERANRFLDRRFVVNLPGGENLGFFGDINR